MHRDPGPPAAFRPHFKYDLIPLTLFVAPKRPRRAARAQGITGSAAPH